MRWTSALSRRSRRAWPSPLFDQDILTRLEWPVEVQLREPLRVKKGVDLRDLATGYRECHHREHSAVWCHDRSRGPVHERRSGERVELCVGRRVRGNGLRAL